jgi:hypothetical protein
MGTRNGEGVGDMILVGKVMMMLMMANIKPSRQRNLEIRVEYFPNLLTSYVAD